jgi:hypothetical protein
MFTHPDLTMSQFNQRRNELIAEADRSRVLARVRRGRKARHTRSGRSPS